MVSLVESMKGDHPVRAALVLSNRPDAGGLAKAAAMGIETDAIDHKPFGKDRGAFENVLHERLLKAEPDIICLAGFMRILTGGFIEKWSGKMLNIHPSLLPKYKGLNTHARAIEAGDKEHGCSVHEVTANLDDGPILGQARLEIESDDTPDVLAAKVLPLEHQLYPAVLERFALGDKTPVFLP